MLLCLFTLRAICLLLLCCFVSPLLLVSFRLADLLLYFDWIFLNADKQVLGVIETSESEAFSLNLLGIFDFLIESRVFLQHAHLHAEGENTASARPI